MQELFLVSWKEPYTGKKEHRTTPMMPGPAAALCWLYRLKPYILKPETLATVEIKPWKRGDPR